MSQKHDLSLVSLNTKGLINTRKRQAVFRWVKKHSFDIVFLQETHSSKEVERNWKNEWGGVVHMSHGSRDSRGCMILFKKGLDVDITSTQSDNYGRFILIECIVKDEPLTLLNVYLPNTETEQLLFLDTISQKLESLVNNHTNVNFVCGGDWNIVRDAKLDKMGGIINIKEKSNAKLENIMSTFELNDTWRIKNPNLERYTWRQRNPLIQCRLDYWLVSDNIYDYVSNTDILPSVHSDHSAISIQLTFIPKQSSGPCFWKFNNSLLEDQEYISLLEDKLDQWQTETEFKDKQMSWEYIKYQIRKTTMAFSKRKRQKQKDKERELEIKLINLEKRLTSKENLLEYEETKQELKRIELEKIQGIIIRSRIQWHEEGERSTKFFLGLEKSNAIKKTMRRLKLPNGSFTTDPEKILHAQKQFYEKLLTTTVDKSNKIEQTEEDVFFKINNIPTLKENEKETCEGLISVEECEAVLKTFKNNKSPGNDGISKEFYVHFWPKIKNLMVEAFNASYINGKLSTSQKQAIITLIEKKGKDRTQIKNWRPISLLNVDYKIVSKVIAKRIQSVLPKLIHINQSGFIQNRFIGDTIRTILDIIDYTDFNNKEGLLMMIDFEKAYDSVEWDFMFKVLKKYNFGEMLIKWIKTFYFGMESCVTNNGNTSNYFKITRGMRQGDPLSSYLFVLIVEILAIAVRDNNNIHGITIDNHNIKILQYADDTTAILSDLQSAKEFISLLNKFKYISGLGINIEKTEAIWLGAFKNRADAPLGIKWSKEPVKLLGIYISSNQDLAVSYNFDKRIKKMKTMLNQWKQRDLTLIGKVLVIKSYAISQLLYIANLLPFPKHKYKEIEDILYEFVWNCKTKKVKKNILIQDYSKGGCKMPDVQSIVTAQKLKWVKQFLGNHECSWSHTMKALINVSNLNVLLYSNFKTRDLQSLTPFYAEVLTALESTRSVDNESDVGISNQLIFYNDNIRIENKTIFDKNLFEAGLWKVKDLFNENNQVISFEVLQRRGIRAEKYMVWRSIVTIVSQKWKNRISFTDHDKIQITINNENADPKDLLSMETRDLCKILVSKKTVTSKAMANFNKRLNYECNGEQLAAIYLLPHKLLYDNKIKEFQFKILHQYIPTNKLLFKMRKIDNYKCSFCNLYCEDIYHLFYSCLVVKDIWMFVEQMCRDKLAFTTNLSCRDVIFGYKLDESSPFVSILNKVILYCKYYIWRCKHTTQMPTNAGLTQALKNHELFDEDIHNLQL